MAVEWLTYSDIGARLGCSPEAARARAIRHEWPRRTGNDGRAECKVDLEEFVAAIPPYRREKAAERQGEARSTPEHETVEPPEDGRAIEALEAHIETLKGVVAMAEAAAAKAEQRAVLADARAETERGRADVERARADELAARVDGMQVEAIMAAKAGTEHDAKVESDLAELRRLVDAMKAPTSLPEPRAWWRRLAG